MNVEVGNELQPYIRQAHHYRFPVEQNGSEAHRIGYCYAFHLVIGGKGRMSTALYSCPLKKGDLIFIPPRSTHSFYSDPNHPLSTYNVYCELWTDRPLDTDIHLVWNDADFDKFYLTPAKPDSDVHNLPPLNSLQHRDPMSVMFAHIVSHRQSKEPGSATIASTLLKAFILELLQISRESTLTDKRIQSVIERIDFSPDEGQYETWLEQTGLRKTQFHELFKQATGLSPKAYRTRAVMKRAAIHLTGSNRSVTDIAAGLGYSSIHHFTKQFTAFYGLSPTEYRKRK